MTPVAMPNAGDLRERLRFERKEQLDPAGPGDGAGNFEGDFKPLFGAQRAALWPSRGGAPVIDQRLQGTVVFDLWIYSNAGTRRLQVGDRVVDTRNPNRVFSVRTPPMDMDGRRAWLMMQVEQGVAT